LVKVGFAGAELSPVLSVKAVGSAMDAVKTRAADRTASFHLVFISDSSLLGV
jgi:hypothetical protein